MGGAARRSRARSCRRTLDDHGPASVGAYFGTAAVFDANLYWAGARFLRRLGSPTKFTSGTVDAPSYPGRAPSHGGSRMALPQHRFRACDDDVAPRHEPRRLPQRPHAGVPESHRADSRARPAGRGVGVDARRTETAKLATRHLAPRPGTDYALLAFLIRELAPRGRRPRLPRRPRDARRRAAQRPSSASTPGRSRRITGLAADELVDLLAAVRRHGRLALQTGTGTVDGPGRQSDPVVRGRASRRHRAPSSGRAGCGSTRASSRGSTSVRAPRTRDQSQARRAGPELPRQGGEYPSITMLDEMEAGNLQALFVLGGNVLSALPDAQRVRAALERTPVVVVSDVQHGDMTEVATHVLAAAGPARAGRPAALLGLPRAGARGPVHPAGRSGRRRPEARLGGRSPRSASASGRRSCRTA